MTDVAIEVCFVCLGNICRSPTAEGVMVQLVSDGGFGGRIAIDSAGTGAYHVGECADPRSAAEARRRGVELKSRARQFVVGDYDRFDYVIAMDHQNHRHLASLARSEADRAKLHMLRDFDPDARGDKDVPDPYYGGARGFERVYDICEAGCRGLLAHIAEVHRL